MALGAISTPGTPRNGAEVSAVAPAVNVMQICVSISAASAVISMVAPAACTTLTLCNAANAAGTAEIIGDAVNATPAGAGPGIPYADRIIGSATESMTDEKASLIPTTPFCVKNCLKPIYLNLLLRDNVFSRSACNF